MAGMKMEFLKSGAPDCPLIRLYEFKPSEAQSLRRIALQLARGRTEKVLLHEERGILATGACKLVLSRGDKDRGVFETGPLKFLWELTVGAWHSISGLIRPFTQTDSIRFQCVTSGDK